MPSKISQREKDEYCMISLTCRILKKKSPMHAVKSSVCNIQHGDWLQYCI